MRLLLSASLSIACSSCAHGARVAGPTTDAASSLVGQRYRVRWGALDMPGVDDPVDAHTGVFGFLSEGPFEQELEIRASEVETTAIAEDPASPRAPRRLRCVDVRPSPSRITGATKSTVVVLDVQPIGDAPAVPFVVDESTGAKLAIDATKLLDENNAPCDHRMRRRAEWDDNLRRLHERRRR